MNALYTKDFVICPWCDAQTGSSVNHLYGQPGLRTEWVCKECRRYYSVAINGPGDVDVARVDSAQGSWTRTMTLLKRADSDLFFVMDHDRYLGLGEPDDDAAHSLEYFFEEHSCPTNWLSECVAVIDDGDTDPHGFLVFVRHVDVPRDFDDGQQDWREMFPEAFAASSKGER